MEQGDLYERIRAQSRGEGPAAAAGAPEQEDEHATRERAHQEWARNAALRAEFPTEGSYVAFKVAEAAGRIKRSGVRRGHA